MKELKKPFFSIVIPALNEEKYLPKLLGDLANQSFLNIEIIIVDGSSDDQTIAKAQKFRGKFKNLRIISAKKKNVSHQRNLGAKMAEAEWLIFMDADDRLPAYFLLGIKYRIESLYPDVLSTQIIPDSKSRKDKIISDIANLLVDIQKSNGNPFVLEAFLAIKKQSFQKLNGFNEELFYLEGNDLIKRALKLGMKFDFTKDPKYTCSFRGFRKKGIFKRSLNVLLIELSRLANIEIPKDKAKNIYPMDRREYFEIDSKTTSPLKEIYLKIIAFAKS